MAKAPKNNEFPSIALKYIDVAACPICGALPVTISIADAYDRFPHKPREEVTYACQCTIRYEDGRRSVYRECSHLKHLMDKLVQDGITTEELLTSGSPLEKVLGRIRHEEAERDERLQKLRQEAIDKEKREIREKSGYHDRFFQ
jgi:hypothetical protein